MNVTINVELSSNPKPDGTQQLMLRITENRKHRRVKLDWSIKKKDWNPKEQEVRRTDTRYRQINEGIRLKKLEVEEQILENYRKRDSNSADKIVKALKGEGGPGFFPFAEKFVNRKREASYGNFKRYTSVLNKIRIYWEKIGNGKELALEDITVAWLRDYESYLRKLGNEQNTVYANIRSIRAIIYDAIREDLFDQAKNPFFKYKIKYIPVEREKLTEEEITRIEALELKKDSTIWHCRNVFLFSFYQAGMRVGDVLFAKFGDFGTGRNEYEMDKTKRHVSIKLVDQAVDIIELYRRPESRDEDYLFPFIPDGLRDFMAVKGQEFTEEEKLTKIKEAKTALVNKYLKSIAEKAGINKTITMHIARHSFSEIAIEKGISIYDLSKLLKHSSVKIVESHYLSKNASKTLDQSLENVYKKKTS